MIDYETLYVPSIGSPRAGLCSITISEGKVGIMAGTLEVLGYPKRIKIHRGVRTNSGKIVIEAADEDPGAILVDYDRKKVCFYSKEILDPLKEMIRQYAKGEFTPGIYFLIKGVVTEEKAVEFDFRDAFHRIVNVSESASNALDRYRQKTYGKKENKKSSGHKNVTAFNAASGFNMPKMAGKMT